MPAPSESFPSVVHDIYPGIDPSKFTGANKGRVVLVTGASKGLGLASAKAYAATGASLYIAARSVDVLAKIKTELEATYNVPVAFGPVDVASEASIKAAVDKAVETYGRLDVVIANAGGSDKAALIGELPLAEEWWACQERNLKGSFYLTSYALPELRKNKGYVVYLSSILAHLRTPRGSGYNIAKMSLIRLAEWVDAENKDIVKAFAMHPGAVVTDLSAGIAVSSDYMKAIFIDTPELTAWTQVRLTSGSEDWLSGRYIDSNWDLDVVAKHKSSILEEDALKMRFALPSTLA